MVYTTKSSHMIHINRGIINKLSILVLQSNVDTNCSRSKQNSGH